MLTHREMPDEEEIRFIGGDVCGLVQKLQQEDGKGIWICGSASIAWQLVDADLIDRYHISVIPMILGDGIPLFGRMDRGIRLNCVGTRTYNGITDLVYERRKTWGTARVNRRRPIADKGSLEIKLQTKG